MGLPGGFAAAQVARRLLADHQHIDRAAVPSQRHEHPADAARARRVLVGVAAAVVERARAGGSAAEESAEVIPVDTPRRRLVQQLARGSDAADRVGATAAKADVATFVTTGQTQNEGQKARDL